MNAASLASQPVTKKLRRGRRIELLPDLVPPFDKKEADAALAAFLDNKTLENRKRLVQANLRQAFSIVIKMQGECRQHRLREELGAAAIGLVDAANTFDPKRGCQFSTYAYRCAWHRVRQTRVDEWRKSHREFPASSAIGDAVEVMGDDADGIAIEIPSRELTPDCNAECREISQRRIKRSDILRVVKAALSCGDDEKYRRHRIAFYLACIRGWRYQDAGDLLGVTRERVRQLMEVVKYHFGEYLRRRGLMKEWRQRWCDWMSVRDLAFD